MTFTNMTYQLLMHCKVLTLFKMRTKNINKSNLINFMLVLILLIKLKFK